MVFKNEKATVLFFSLLLLLTLVSCNKPRLSEDEFITKFDKFNFSEFKGSNISIRDGDFFNIYYVVGNADENSLAYYVKYNTISERIINIDKFNIKKKSNRDYLTKEQISNLNS